LDDHERLYLAEMVPAAESAVAKSVRGVRLADGAAVPVADVRACFGNRLHETGRGVLLQDLGDNDGPALRLVELKTARVLWKKKSPAASIILDSPNAPGLLGVLTPDNEVHVIDLKAAREALRLKLDPAPEHQPQMGVLLADAEQLYVGLSGESSGGSQPHFGGGLAEAPVHGSLYAFPRRG